MRFSPPLRRDVPTSAALNALRSRTSLTFAALMPLSAILTHAAWKLGGQFEDTQVRREIPADQPRYFRDAETRTALEISRIDPAKFHAGGQKFDFPLVVHLAQDVHSQCHGQVVE